MGSAIFLKFGSAVRKKVRKSEVLESTYILHMLTVIFSIQQHDEQPRLFATFPYDRELITIIKTVPGARWSSTRKQWHFHLNWRVTELLKEKLNGKAALDLSLLNCLLYTSDAADE